MKVDTNEITAALLLDMKADIDDVIAGYHSNCCVVELPVTPILKYIYNTYGCNPCSIQESTYFFWINNESFMLEDTKYGLKFALITGR